MGKFVGKPWRDEDGKEYAFCIAWGTVTRDPKTTCFSKPKVEIGIKWKRGEFLNVEAWGESPAYPLLCSLEKGENVLVMGLFKKFTYTTRDGVKKEGTSVNCEICLPMSILQYVLTLYSSPSLQMLVQADQDKPDPMESADDLPADYDPFAQQEDEYDEPSI